MSPEGVSALVIFVSISIYYPSLCVNICIYTLIHIVLENSLFVSPQVPEANPSLSKPSDGSRETCLDVAGYADADGCERRVLEHDGGGARPARGDRAVDLRTERGGYPLLLVASCF